MNGSQILSRDLLQLGISGGYLRTSKNIPSKGTFVYFIVAEICIGLQVRIFIEKRMTHKWVT